MQSTRSDSHSERGLPVNTLEVLKARYLRKNDQQQVIETPDEMFRRVARHVAGAEEGADAEAAEERFYGMMHDLEFMPNSPTLMNAGTAFGQLSACFVLPVEDSIDGIFDALKNMALIHQSGGGTGFDFSRLRPKDDLVRSTKGRASGPVSFLRIFDQATGVIVQGGRRRGANMGILRCDHPDIIEFVEAKTRQGRFENFNLSVAVTDAFMEAAKADRPFELKHPATGRAWGTLQAGRLFDRIVQAAWRCGDPGLFFIDEVNRHNPTPQIGRIEATNPCGELPLLAYESCNLASINLAKCVKNGALDWPKLKERVYWGIRFLDNVVQVNRYPLGQIEILTRANRKIGLGVMGFADMLILLGIAYDSPEAPALARKLMRFISNASFNASIELAERRGVFPNFPQSVYARQDVRLRNATVNTVAPTGTISMIAGCSSGIEPLFAVSYVRHVLSGRKLFEVNPIFEEMARDRRIYTDELLEEIAQTGSLRSIDRIPADLKRLFATAFDVEPMQHLKIQAAFQRYTDNAVSKTINLPESATVKDVRNIYLKAHELGCKGITVYRYNSKDRQVLNLGAARRETSGKPYITADPEYTGGCIGSACSF